MRAGFFDERKRQHASSEIVTDVKKDGIHARIVKRLTVGPNFEVINQQVENGKDGNGHCSSRTDERK